MSLINRNNHISQQKVMFNWMSQAQVNTGATFIVAGPMPYPYRIDVMAFAATGVSSAMQAAVSVQRFIPGAGNTSITIGVSNMVLRSYGTSGFLGYSGLPTAGSTLLTGLAGDVFMLTTSVSNAAAAALALSLVLVKTQDIVTYHGI